MLVRCLISTKMSNICLRITRGNFVLFSKRNLHQKTCSNHCFMLAIYTGWKGIWASNQVMLLQSVDQVGGLKYPWITLRGNLDMSNMMVLMVAG
uniref:Uncharacterized protein n=1 Tax=Arundo donax TaxID=35708 RepID=A0A0A9E4G6_ARUDO